MIKTSFFSLVLQFNINFNWVLILLKYFTLIYMSFVKNVFIELSFGD